MATFRLSVKAKSDLKQIARHTETVWGRAQRNSYLKSMDEAFHLISSNPSIGFDCRFIRAGYRKFPQGSHLIFYTAPAGATVEIIRILHKRTDVTQAG